ncbi:hypothetical protein H0H93_015473, partial [Arthromyces matolae]
RLPDKATFVPTIARIVNTWYARLLWRLDSDNFPEWTEELLAILSSGKKQLIIELSPPPHNRPRTYWNFKTSSFYLVIPKLEPPPNAKIVAAFDQDFDNLLNKSGTGPTDEGWDDLATDAPASRSGAPDPRRPVATHAVSEASRLDDRPKTDRLPELQELSRPNDLFAQTSPYILTLDIGVPLVIRCSHEPTLDLLAAYFNRWGRPNTNDSQRGLVTELTAPQRNVYKVELVESAFLSGINDTLIVEPYINFRSYSGNINPTLLLAFIEGVLGYKMVHTNGNNW